MKLYTGNKLDEIKEVKLINIIADNYKKNTNLKVEIGYNSDDSGAWISLKKETETEEKDLVIQFNYDGTEIDGAGVYVTPVQRILVDDKCIKTF